MSLLKWAIRHWISGFIGLAIGLGIGSAALYDISTQPPVVLEGVETADDVVQDGTSNDTISFVVHFERKRSCPVQVSRFLWRWVDYRGERIKEFRGIDNPPLTPMPNRGQQAYMITLHVPNDMPPGQWYERTVTITQCPMLGNLFASPASVSPDRPITVVAKP